MNGYTIVINLLISIPLERKTASLSTVYTRKWGGGDSTQLNLWRRKGARKRPQEIATTLPSSISQLGKGPARPVITKLRRPRYAEASVYTISLSKRSSLPLTMSIPSGTVVHTVMCYHPQRSGSKERGRRSSSGLQRHSVTGHGRPTFGGHSQQEGMEENTV